MYLSLSLSLYRFVHRSLRQGSLRLPHPHSHMAHMVDWVANIISSNEISKLYCLVSLIIFFSAIRTGFYIFYIEDVYRRI